MKIYFDKLKEILKNKSISRSKFCREFGISRMTFWNWENGINTPTETKIREIALTINVPVNTISDLKPGKRKSEKDLSENLTSWLQLAGKTKGSQEQEEKQLNDLIKTLQKKLQQASILVRAFTDSTKAIFYIKDLNSKYILVNEAFLNMVSFKPNSNVAGLDDYSFFNKHDAKQNYTEDREVLLKGISIDSAERFLPGSRNKKWGLVFKHPIFDTNDKLAGIIGVFVDITTRKEQEKINTLLSSVVSAENSVIFLLKKSSKKIMFISNNSEQLFNFKPEKYLKKSLSIWINDYIQPNDREIFLKYLDTNTWPSTLKARISIATYQDRVIKIDKFEYDEFYILRHSDMTERHRDELRSKYVVSVTESAAIHLCAINRNHFILENNELNILQKRDTVQNMLQLNDAMITILKIPDNELGIKDGKKFIKLEYWFDHIHPDYRKQEIKYWSDGSWPDKRRYKVFTSEGEERWIESKFYPGNTEYDFSVDTDITDIINEEDIKHKEDKLKLVKLLLKNNIPNSEIAEASAMTVEELSKISC